MLIKRKYTFREVKSQVETPAQNEESINNVKSDETTEIKEKLQDEKTTSEQNKQDVKTEKETDPDKNKQNPKEQPKPEEKNIPDKKKVEDDFDLSIDDIKFEQREERRDGTRRRGYRRMQDRNVISRAQEDAKTIKEQAKQDGYKDGIAQAKKELEQLNGKLAEFYGYKDEIFDKVSDCIYDISVEIAKKILNKEIETDKTSIIQMIKNAVEEVNRTENKITLKVMPQEVEIVKNKVPEIFSSGGFDAAISVVADKTIKEGGVIVETSNGIIDATISTQMAIIEKVLCNKTEGKE